MTGVQTCALPIFMMVQTVDGEETYGQLTKDKVIKLLDEIRASA